MAENKNEIIKAEDVALELQKIEILDNSIRIKAQNFNKILHKNPVSSEIQINSHANDSKYLPISFIEMTMDELFFGLWSTKNFNTKVIANEIVGELEVEFFHPVHKIMLTRIGAAGVQIQQIKNSEITDMTKKIKNTLQKDYPHLKADCFRNACLSIGKIFGRDLNRDFNDQFKPLIKDTQTPEEIARKKIIDALDIYQGSDKEKIRELCATTEWTMEFAKEIAESLGVEV